MALRTATMAAGPGLPRALIESGLPAKVCEQVTMALAKGAKTPKSGGALKIVYRVPAGGGGADLAQLDSVSYVGRDGKSRKLSYAPLPMPADLRGVSVEPARAMELAEPLPGARISSPFGWRMHPVFHTVRFHKGVDFEAPEGTPVRASADGVIEEMDDHGNYGNYVRIEHSNRIETAYAHLSGFAAGLEPGDRVRRGQIIGYVGMTGVATGPHLYYEVLVDDRQIDPEPPLLKVGLAAAPSPFSHLRVMP